MMLNSNATLALLVSAALLAPPAFASNVGGTSSGTQSARHKLSQGRHKAVVRHARGQQAMEPERVTEIQQALIREHYLTGDANGNWDTTTQTAMQKFQADNGWQTKLMPDSRAIKKLGLGPDYSGAINAKEGNFTSPTSAGNIPSAQVSGFAQASGVHQ
jgi:peptidoglycan hydrolase-like protein with peptidoglycan-binding domain